MENENSDKEYKSSSLDERFKNFGDTQKLFVLQVFSELEAAKKAKKLETKEKLEMLPKKRFS